ncbi:interleukin enhancer-binding factor 3 [Spatholobus suberectus]|nr:interleukin enhancer-binding factor 3 [Spatholobus suberectus]
MAQFGYTYRTVSTYNTSSGVRSEMGGPVIKPFAPFVPKVNGNGPSEGHVTRKIIVPVASRPYGDESDDDEYCKPQPTSPVRGSVMTSPDWRHGSNKPIGGTEKNDKHDGHNNGTNYGNKPFGGTIKNDNRYGNNNGTNYGSKPFGGTFKNDYHDGYNNGTNYGYGDHAGRKPIESTIKPIGGAIRNDKYDGTNGYGGDYRNKERRNLIGDPVKRDNYDGHNGYGPYGGYGDYNNKAGPKPKPTGSHVNGHGGYGIGNGNDKDRGKPFGSAGPTRHDNYDSDSDSDGDHGNYNNKEGHKNGGPKAISGWTASPRKGTQLSKPTNDIGEAMELLKEAAKLNGNDRGYNGGPKPKPYEYDNRVDGPSPLMSRPAPPAGNYDKTMILVNESERLKKINVTDGPPIQSRPNVPIKDETRPNGNFKLAPMRQRFNLVDGRGPDYDTRRSYDEVINHKEAEKRFNGVTLP